VVTGLENMKRLLHENLLPALERCSVILSRFAGIAKFQESDDIVGFSSHQISLIMDTLACLNLVYSKILVHAVDELDLFSSFSSWLRYEIDRLVSDPSQSSTGEEGPEQEGSIDHSKVLLYLQTAMTTSPLAVYFTTISSDAGAGDDWARGDHGLSLFNSLDSQLQKQEQGLPYASHLLQVDFLFNVLSRQTTTIFGQIAEAEKRNVLFGKAEELHGIESSAVLDMKMSPKVFFSCLFADRG
jgi:anaphase-promoting complex subunit 4